ncbi:hypothetical protein MBLNU230_g5692t1 [Neophaeotheca triangularis]
MSSATTMNGAGSGGGGGRGAGAGAGGIGGAGQNKQQLKNTAGGKAVEGTRKQQSPSPIDGQNRKQQSPQHKAWQSPNPIVTQRAPSSHVPNGIDKSSSKATSLSQSASETEAEEEAHRRLVHMLSNFKGSDATLTLKNGERFTGVFCGAKVSSTTDQQYHLKMVKRTRQANHQQVNGAAATADEFTGEGEDHSMVFDVRDTADLSVSNVTTASARPTQNGTFNMLPTPPPSANAITFPGSASAFRTDTEISSQRDRQMLRERELKPWVPDNDAGIDMSLESGNETGWDQFAANEQMYGVQSTYDENIYTTEIDRSNPAYRQQEARAARIAREIEGSAPANAHVAEERRREAAAGSGMDEEEKYSGVRRDAPDLPRGGAGSYVPPSRRPLTNAPTVPGAPFDPAIISLEKPATKVQGQSAAEGAQAQRDVQGENKEAKPAIQAAPRKSGDNTAEDHMRAAADSFKQFANNEKLKMRQAQEQKRAGARHEKNVKLNDLKKFAASFQLKSRVPDDLVPILAKDVEKQQDIQRKAEEAAREAELNRKAGVSPASKSPANVLGSSSTSGDPRLFDHSRNRSNQAATGSQPGQSQPALTREQRIERNTALFNSKVGQRRIPPPQPLPAGLVPKAPAALSQIQNQRPTANQSSVQPQAPAQAPVQDNGSMSPASATRLNVNAKAFEFRPNPVASEFTPTGSSPSPQRKQSSQQASKAAPTVPKFLKPNKETKEDADEDAQDTVSRLASEAAEDQKKTPSYKNIGGIPPPYKTAPIWFSPEERKSSYLELFPRGRHSSHGQPMMPPADPNVHIPHVHQLPPHMQSQHQMGTPQFAPRGFQPPHNMPHFAPSMGQFGSNGSVQSSPRFPPAQVAYNGQMPPQMGMPQYQGGPMPGYAMSPGMQYRQMNMPQANQNMMMQGPPHGNSKYNAKGKQKPNNNRTGPADRAQVPPQMRQNFPGQGPPPPPFGNPGMGGQMMVQQPSGGYMGGPMPQQQAQYSPMPQHPQPHFQGGTGQHMQPGNTPYANSPRPHPMSHQGSHQGYQPQQQQQHQGGPGMPPMGGIQGNFGGPSPNHQGMPQPHPYHMQQRQMSNQGYTPRGQNAMPMNMQQQQQQGGYQGGGGPSHQGGPNLSQGGDEGK